MVGDPAIDDVANVETVAENLACALEQTQACIHMATLKAEDWTLGKPHRGARRRTGAARCPVIVPVPVSGAAAARTVWPERAQSSTRRLEVHSPSNAGGHRA